MDFFYSAKKKIAKFLRLVRLDLLEANLGTKIILSFFLFSVFSTASFHFLQKENYYTDKDDTQDNRYEKENKLWKIGYFGFYRGYYVFRERAIDLLKLYHMI